MSQGRASEAPRSVDGWWVTWLWKRGDPTEGWFRSQSVFLSPALEELFGKRACHFENEGHPASQEAIQAIERSDAVYEIDIESLRSHRYQALPFDQEMLSELGLSGENWELLLTDELSEFVFGESNSYIATTAARGSAAPASVQRYGAYETSHRSSVGSLGNGVQRRYSGPLFAYALDHNTGGASTHKLVQPVSPINVAWESSVGLPTQNTPLPTNVAFHMNTTGSSTWGHSTLQALRHVVVADGGRYALSGQVDDVTKPISGPKQWHARLFRVPSRMDGIHPVVAQAHRDPYDHNLRSKLPGVSPSAWQLADARKEVSDHWVGTGFTRSRFGAGNDSAPGGMQFTSSNGTVDVVRYRPGLP